ncbi:MAG: methyltransferase domain-containing protein [Bacteroidales bacterium]
MKLKQRIVNIGKNIIPFEIRIFFRKLNWRRYYLQQIIFGELSRTEVYCPIAKKSFKKFIKISGDLVTPSNGARSRQRLVWHYLENELDILTKNLRVLHIAPELSYLEILRKQKNLEYIPGDKMVQGYSNQKGIKNVDLTQIEFNNDCFDYIIANHVLEHIPNDKKAMTEMFRVLKNGGIGVVTVPINEKLDNTYEDSKIILPDDREKHFGQWDHLRLYGLDIKKRFEEVGFDVEMNRYYEKFSKEDYEKFGFCKDIIIVLRKTTATRANSQ